MNHYLILSFLGYGLHMDRKINSGEKREERKKERLLHIRELSPEKIYMYKKKEDKANQATIRMILTILYVKEC